MKSEPQFILTPGIMIGSAYIMRGFVIGIWQILGEGDISDRKLCLPVYYAKDLSEK
jgi:hypothetical protein